MGSASGGEKYVLCVGPNPALQRTLWFPSLALGEVNRALRKRVSGGGKGTNVARILGQLGYPAKLLTFVGGTIGEEFVRTVRREDIEVKPVQAEAETRVCLTLIEEDESRQTELVEEAEGVCEDDVRRFLRVYSELLEGCSFVVISGTSPAGVPEDFYGELTRRAGERGVPVIVDAPGQLLRHAVPYRPLLAKPNRKELAALFPGLGFEQQVLRLRELGAQNVLITDGGNAAWLLAGDAHFRLVPPVVQPVNPIGSGDAVAAGIALALLEGKDIVEAVRFGIACGTANTLTELAGHVDPTAVERLLPLVEVETVDESVPGQGARPSET